ncbi:MULTISPECIES: Eco57I restriction-modification methylase domain-containing protein [unclassified Cyanobium]|uniref:Eco57I restriction-modification methylase domain-containing protein n=1 Tax=unclassified Cyanobium TaxID=2627006 RepID=UPI0020CE87FF|nr:MULTISPECIES: DNA methyltransferase [unclassified Cyanobium]MCP9859456.1 N-6 DNA methylase [Cyanobium sp. Cruz-8H5]MCP9866602.1 N-6 DNA methylase [Cyanobium sp. Cruz-8D1]
MANRGVQRDPELLAHREWLGYLQPVGLVVAPAAMQDAGWVVTRSGSELIERQERYRESLEALGSEDEADAEDRELGFSSIETLLVDHLGWSGDQVQSDPNLIEGYTRELPELGETLQPSAVVPAASGDGAQLLVQALPLLTPLDQKVTGGEHLWRASAQERFERLLRETGVEAGLLFNGSQLRLVVAPKGESSGHITFLLKDLAEVSGRLMFSGLDLLLGVSHVFLDPDGYRLADVLKKSRSFQAVVSNALADQVLAALWDLLRGFQQADELSQRQGSPLLRDLPDRDPQQLYGGLITVLMRLVFLLYAEDNALLPKDAVYEQNYKVSGVFERLEQDAAEFPDTMEQRYGAWAGLMSLCRLVFAGGGPTVDYLPARKGQLFNPEAYPWLETPWISDGVVHEVLSNLLVVKGERISYRALDVEQIGSVYEGIMGYAVRRIPGRCIGLKSKPQGAKKQLTTAVDLDALLALSGAKRKAWLEEQAATTLPAKAANALKAATSEAELLEALAPRIDRSLFEGPQATGSLVFQPTEERRRSGSHYTPRALTRPIVEEALRPWLDRCGGKPTVAQILALKICDPAMGSGAFLVECCRYLAELLELAWSREGLPDALQPGGSAHGEEPLIYARRLIAQSCLYGVDKNPFAVNLARLSLWLVSLSKDAPFTFVDHALKCGDSLVGMERGEIEKALKGASLQRELQITLLDQVRQQEARSFALFHADSRSDADDAQKRQALDALNASTAYLRTVGDLLVAAFFNGKKAKDRVELKQLYLAATLQHSSAAELEDELAEPLERLREGEKGITPLHWQFAFPDVFGRVEPGFDVVVGNPPFAGKNTIAEGSPDGILDWFKQLHPESHGNADLVAHFFRRCFDLLRPGGSLGLIATNTIAQGDTRSTGLRWICLNGGTIYAARKRYKWPGVAAVVVSVVHLFKGAYAGVKLLERRPVQQITAFLFANGGSEDPKQLASNAGKSFVGSYVLGMGFTFDDSSPADDDTPGIPSPIATMERLIAENPKNVEVILPYIGGEEVNSSPTHAHHRYVINFGERSEEECRREWPDLMAIVDRKVKPGRLAQNREIRARYWWRFGETCPALYEAIAGCERVLALSRHQQYWQITFMPTGCVFSEATIVISTEESQRLAALQSQLHEEWLRFLGSSLEERLRYTPSDCFETFPFPTALLDSAANDPAHSATCQSLEAIGERYHQFRAELMVSNNEGLTSTYNRFHDPAETSSGLLELRRLHVEMDQAILAAYGWSDVLTDCGFGLDYLDLEDDAQLPDDLQDRIDSGELFFWEPDEACAFEAQVRAYGAVKGKKKLPWRYRWSDDVRDDVLARLLALNAERYAEEVAQGLHGKGGKKAAKVAAIAGGAKKRGRPSKAASAGDSGQTEAQQVEQMGLGL